MKKSKRKKNFFYKKGLIIKKELKRIKKNGNFNFILIICFFNKQTSFDCQNERYSIF